MRTATRINTTCGAPTYLAGESGAAEEAAWAPLAERCARWGEQTVDLLLGAWRHDAQRVLWRGIRAQESD
eukprot:6326115-Prymnesium_polylepis.1